MLALVGCECISDRVVNNYLALVCHRANRHFTLQDPLAKQSGSPKWHAWDTFTGESLKRNSQLGKVWPPPWYPEAKLEDTEVQLFPWHVDMNHWCLGVLTKVDGSWVLDQYSTLPGYDTGMASKWAEVEEYLSTKSDGAINALMTEIRYSQAPEQTNGTDCGPFILCIARWLMEGWPLTHITPELMAHLRRRMAFELERWSLD